MFADLHKQYGEVVRVSPTEVSFTSGETAWQDIYGFRIGKFKGHSNTQKVRPIAAQRLRQDPMWYARPPNGANSILIADDTRHSQGRKLLSHAFSEKALAQQEPLVMRYVDQLIDGLKDTIRAKDEVVDMAKWYNWTTFDIIADLTFGEPFGCLQDHATHKYITLLFNGIKAMNFQLAFRQLPVTKWFSPLLLDKNSLPPVEVRREFLSWVSSQVQKRLDRETERPDFMGHILANNGEKGYSMSKAEMDSNASLMLSAGSETTATMLSGATYALLKHPRVLEKLKKEVRERWNDYHEIDVATTNKAPYLNAVISEALRYFPPVPAGFNRQIQKGTSTSDHHGLRSLSA
jgi:cytochrome P450